MTANILSFLCLKFYLISTGGTEITEEKKRVGILEESRAFRDRHASKERSFSCERGFSCVTPSILKLSTFFRKIPLNVSTKTWNDLKTPENTYNHLQPPTTIYNHLKNFSNHLQPPQKHLQPLANYLKPSKTRHKCPI